MPGILYLTLKRNYFDMIASGEKKEEYRDWKPYWVKRFLQNGMKDVCAVWAGDNSRWKEFDKVLFRNGYSSSAPVMEVEIINIKLGNGKHEWGATNKCIIIRLGKIISIKNYNQ